MTEMDNLKEALYQTIGDVDLWQEVLRHIAVMTGVKKGLITLRERLSAELYIPCVVHYDFASPMLYGFSNQEVEDYVTHYMQFDPWTEFEKLYHPVFPYALSKYVNEASLKSSPFWQWLEPQGISDTIVIDIGISTKSWVAMNLYYPTEQEDVKRKALALTTEILPLMTEVWKQGQRYRITRFAPQNLDYFLEQQLGPSLLIDSNGIIMQINPKARQLLKDGAIAGKGIKGQLIFKDRSLKVNFNQAMEELKTAYFDIHRQTEALLSSHDCVVKLILLEKPENTVGENTGLRLVNIDPPEHKGKAAHLPIWDGPELTKRERQLVELLANGGKVVDFMRKYTIAKSTAHFHWGNVKKKLDIRDKSEIFAQHQVFLKNL